MNFGSEKSVSLYFATVLRRILTVGAFVYVYFLKVKLLAVIENGTRVVGEKPAPFAVVLPLVVIVRVDDGHIWICFANRGRGS